MVEEVIDTLRTRLDLAREFHARGEHVGRDRADQLARTAQHSTRLAAGLDWMFFDAR